MASSSSGWVVKWLFPHLNNEGQGEGGMTDRDQTHAQGQGLASSYDHGGLGAGEGRRGSSPSPGAGAGHHQWRDLEGVIYDTVKQYLRPLLMLPAGALGVP